ncbi:hypothetical protein BTI_4165 [Burkholderia thailandensis MSMB121]|uniref:hypothetical protein n=1 Tax=Burkholderia humptydooensis TaxID=430531 RepID=UPI000327F3D5|nr:hypothetical protein [Burkholderia humptydooensis]AGK50064.1 hypothetical protein BTI_4165 [Burkholderia thailandensis MSMB121]
MINPVNAGIPLLKPSSRTEPIGAPANAPVAPFATHAQTAHRASTVETLQNGLNGQRSSLTSTAPSPERSGSNAAEKSGFNFGDMLKKLTDLTKAIGEPLSQIFKVITDLVKGGVNMASSLGSLAMSAMSPVLGMVKSIVK